MKRKVRLKAGKKTQEWDEIRRELKKKFVLNGITECEMCGSTWFLTFAHRMKRRYCDREELYRCALLCIPCHNQVEELSHEGMLEAVDNIIKSRKSFY